MNRLLPLLLLGSLAACTGLRSYSRGTLLPLQDVFACAQQELDRLGYTPVLVDSVGGLLQGHREITGLRETARRGASAATEVITVGLAGGKLTRYDELTISIYLRQYPQGRTLEATAGMLSVTDETREHSRPTDDARRDARALVNRCAG